MGQIIYYTKEYKRCYSILYIMTMFFDIGANIGRWALANINACDKIISVEASPITFQRLQAECKHDRITLVNYAVCNNNGEDITFYQADADTISTLNKDWLTDEKSRFNGWGYTEITCKTTTIDALIETYGKPDLIKIDVEAGEYLCVQSLSQKVDLLCFEWAAELNDISFLCLDYLSGIGFSHFYLQFSDEYTFRPPANEFYDITEIKNRLNATIPKDHVGMIWCK